MRAETQGFRQRRRTTIHSLPNLRALHNLLSRRPALSWIPGQQAQAERRRNTSNNFSITGGNGASNNIRSRVIG